VVLDPMPSARRAAWSSGLDSEQPADRLLALTGRRRRGLAAAQLPVLLGVSPDRARALGQASPALRQVGDLWVTVAMLDETGTRCLDLLRRYHRRNAIERGMPLETLRGSLRVPDAVAEAVLADLVRTGRMRRHGGLAALAGFAPRAAGGEAAVDEIVEAVEAAGLTPPSVAELERQTGRRDTAAILRLAASAGRLEAVERDRYYHRVALDRFVRALHDSGAGEIVPSELRQRLGISRKYLIPLLEWADATGVTSWEDGVRRVRSRNPA
jgi:selenocysteine-specific elongation factor